MINYKRLLRKYMSYVADQEGSYFIPSADDPSAHENDSFTREEVELLDDTATSIAAEMYNRLTT